MALTASQRLMLGLYRAAWPAALPFLYLSKRLRSGFKSRVKGDAPEEFKDVWIQAASGGEAKLAAMLAAELCIGKEKPSVMVTSCTDQGVEILKRETAQLVQNGGEVTVAYFPFDIQGTMDRMVEHASPKVIVLLETEIWPGLLAAAKKMDVPVVVVNGRMTSGSLAGYLLFEALLKEIGPERILATSAESASRFSLVFGAGRIGQMTNMKFDALSAAPEADGKENPLSEIIKPGAPFVVMGSVRKEEESEALYALELLLEAKPKTIIGLFPRHMHRLESWKNMLAGAGLTWRLRSELSGPAPQGGVILWDTFGELAHAYAHARAAFVGGTLRPLGGQNFLEPLAYGLTPVIGPFYSNFAWVGEGLFENKLVKRVETARDVAEALGKSLEQRQSRQKVKERVEDFAAEHSGGTRQAAELIRRYL